VSVNANKTYTNTVSLANYKVNSSTSTITSGSQTAGRTGGMSEEEKEYYRNYLLQRDMAANPSEYIMESHDKVYVNPNSQIQYPTSNTRRTNSSNNYAGSSEFTNLGTIQNTDDVNLKQLSLVGGKYSATLMKGTNTIEQFLTGPTQVSLDAMNRAGNYAAEKTIGRIIK
jgi:hypothetical protein